MKFFDRTLCNILQKAVAKKDPANYEPWETALVSALGKTCDWTDKKYLQHSAYFFVAPYLDL